MKGDTLQLDLLGPADVAEFDELYAIYVEAIATPERKTREVLRRMLARQGYRFVVARQHARVIGFAILFSSAIAGVALLEYLAVDASQRGKGIGASLFAEAARLPHAGRGENPLLVEVETDRVAGPDQPARARRMQFYRRMGCRRIEGLSYLLPLDVAGPPPAMELLIHASALPERLPRAILRDWLTAIYRDVYGKPADDPRITRMLAGLPERVELR